MNVEPRCRHSVARATTGRGSIPASQASPTFITAQPEPAPPAPMVPALRINFAIAASLASSLFILLAGPEFTSI